MFTLQSRGSRELSVTQGGTAGANCWQGTTGAAVGVVGELDPVGGEGGLRRGSGGEGGEDGLGGEGVGGEVSSVCARAALAAPAEGSLRRCILLRDPRLLGGAGFGRSRHLPLLVALARVLAQALARTRDAGHLHVAHSDGLQQLLRHGQAGVRLAPVGDEKAVSRRLVTGAPRRPARGVFHLAHLLARGARGSSLLDPGAAARCRIGVPRVLQLLVRRAEQAGQLEVRQELRRAADVVGGVLSREPCCPLLRRGGGCTGRRRQSVGRATDLKGKRRLQCRIALNHVGDAAALRKLRVRDRVERAKREAVLDAEAARRLGLLDGLLGVEEAGVRRLEGNYRADRARLPHEVAPHELHEHHVTFAGAAGHREERLAEGDALRLACVGKLSRHHKGRGGAVVLHAHHHEQRLTPGKDLGLCHLRCRGGELLRALA
eukprot:scaffold29592_cov64-Phaeocystis_antarctica.AAC.2